MDREESPYVEVPEGRAPVAVYKKQQPSFDTVIPVAAVGGGLQGGLPKKVNIKQK
jgi:hypothetical protein